MVPVAAKFVGSTTEGGRVVLPLPMVPPVDGLRRKVHDPMLLVQPIHTSVHCPCRTATETKKPKWRKEPHFFLVETWLCDEQGTPRQQCPVCGPNNTDLYVIRFDFSSQNASPSSRQAPSVKPSVNGAVLYELQSNSWWWCGASTEDKSGSQREIASNPVTPPDPQHQIHYFSLSVSLRCAPGHWNGVASELFTLRIQTTIMGHVQRFLTTPFRISTHRGSRLQVGSMSAKKLTRPAEEQHAMSVEEEGRGSPPLKRHSCCPKDGLGNSGMDLDIPENGGLAIEKPARVLTEEEHALSQTLCSMSGDGEAGNSHGSNTTTMNNNANNCTTSSSSSSDNCLPSTSPAPSGPQERECEGLEGEFIDSPSGTATLRIADEEQETADPRSPLTTVHHPHPSGYPSPVLTDPMSLSPSQRALVERMVRECQEHGLPVPREFHALLSGQSALPPNSTMGPELYPVVLDGDRNHMGHPLPFAVDPPATSARPLRGPPVPNLLGTCLSSTTTTTSSSSSTTSSSSSSNAGAAATAASSMTCSPSSFSLPAPASMSSAVLPLLLPGQSTPMATTPIPSPTQSSVQLLEAPQVFVARRADLHRGLDVPLPRIAPLSRLRNKRVPLQAVGEQCCGGDKGHRDAKIATTPFLSFEVVMCDEFGNPLGLCPHCRLAKRGHGQEMFLVRFAVEGDSRPFLRNHVFQDSHSGAWVTKQGCTIEAARLCFVFRCVASHWTLPHQVITEATSTARNVHFRLQVTASFSSGGGTEDPCVQRYLTTPFSISSTRCSAPPHSLSPARDPHSDPEQHSHSHSEDEGPPVLAPHGRSHSLRSPGPREEGQEQEEEPQEQVMFCERV